MSGIIRKLMREYGRFDQIENPRISFVIHAYNESGDIGRTLESINRQNYLSELIVVDNASTDNTSEIARKYTPHIYRLEDKGIAKARDYGIKKATGDIVVSCDADMIVPDGLTERIIESIRKGYSGGTVRVESDEDIPDANKFYGGMNTYNRFLTPIANFTGHNLKTGIEGLMYFRRDDLKDIENRYGYVFDGKLNFKEGIDLLERMRKNYCFEFVNDKSVRTSPRRIKADGGKALIKKTTRDILDLFSEESWIRRLGNYALQYEDYREVPAKA